jgi:hypothetical protein
MRAGGISTINATATMVGFSEDMISKLHGEVKAFRERAPKDPAIRLVLPPGYDPNRTRPVPY